MDTVQAIASSPLEESSSPAAAPRKIVFRTSGTGHGPITRLVSPSDVGQLIKPFVFLDLIDTRDITSLPKFSWHPHSGIATFTFLLEGELTYADSTGKSGALPEGGVEWMRAGKGVWHTGALDERARNLGFQLWVAEKRRSGAWAGRCVTKEDCVRSISEAMDGSHEAIRSNRTRLACWDNSGTRRAHLGSRCNSYWDGISPEAFERASR